MHTKQPWQALAIGSFSAWAVTAASAAGLGAGGSSAVLGQPLDFAVPVRLDAGEVLGPECVAAEVTAGDRRVPPALVRALVEMTGPDTARVRIVTLPAMDEPVIGIQLTVGCTSKISRRYVVLADPPTALAGSAPAFAANPMAVPEEPAAGSSNAPGAAARSNPPASPVPGADASGPVGSAVSLAPAAGASRPTGRPQVSDPAAAQRRAQLRAERRAARAAREAERARTLPLATAGAAAAPDKPARLKLDFVEPAVASAGRQAVDEALAAVAQAASAAQAAASAASASAERITSLERTVELLRTEASASRDLAAQFKQRLAQAEGSNIWTVPLMVAAALLAALSAWLAWRLGRVQTERQKGWQVAASAVPPSATTIVGSATEAVPSRQPTAPIPFVTSEFKAAPVASVRGGRSTPAWPPPAPPVAWPAADSTLSPETQPAEPITQRTEPLPPTVMTMTEPGAPRDVSIEELIDLEQQAEFFVVLGQDEAAIDLLVEHLRSTGGGSPLPYLKLLEIHHRRGEREAYERMRARFNHRFNAYAPEWGVDLGHGRSLDDYAGVIPRLQQVWPRPLDAMAELEALLFRKSRGELFDLPAYREVLFLYSLARDLLDRGAADNGNVDLLLPMSDGSEFGSTAPSPYLGLERDAFRDTQVPDDQPTSPVDFDVTGTERPTSIFDLLDEKQQATMSPQELQRARKPRAP